MDRDSLTTYITAMIASGDAQVSAQDYDVDAIADDLAEHADGDDVREIDATVFWAAVSRHLKQA